MEACVAAGTAALATQGGGTAGKAQLRHKAVLVALRAWLALEVKVILTRGAFIFH